MSTLRKYQVLLLGAIVAAPLGLMATWIVKVLFWSWMVGVAGIAVSLTCLTVMALTRCPKCHTLLGLEEATREFQSHCCPNCGIDLTKRI